MGLEYRNLDEKTRQFMLDEIAEDISADKLYKSYNLNQQGKKDYPALIKTAAKNGNDLTLAKEIKSRLNTHQKPRKLKSGKYSNPPVMRKDAHEMLAEGEFNRFYIRAVCLRAIEDGDSQVSVYRAKRVKKPRSDSEQKIGQNINAAKLLQDIRENIGIDTALGLPSGPNSGLSVCLKE